MATGEVRPSVFSWFHTEEMEESSVLSWVVPYVTVARASPRMSTETRHPKQFAQNHHDSRVYRAGPTTV